MSEVLVIGGGASGMMAAITAARNGNHVTIVDHNDKLGKKIYITGNGKCNITNLKMNEKYYNGDGTEMVKRVLARFTNQDAISFFHALGLLTKDRNGYVYPHSEQAASVVAVLTYELERLGVAIWLSKDVIRVDKEDERFQITLYDNAHY